MQFATPGVRRSFEAKTNSMGVKITGGGAATSSDVSLLERTIDAPLDPAFLEFVKHNDGGTPEPNIFPVGGDNDADVSQFLPVREIPALMRTIEGLPSGSFPIARAAGGNFVLINSVQGGAVYFWDHELPSQSVKLTDSLQQFLNNMVPFDINKVTLNPDQIKSVL
jgi:hypothetical protein